MNNYSLEIDYLSLPNFENHVVNIGHVNIKSLINKNISINNFLRWTRCSILFITETWLNSNKHDFINFNNYNVITKNRMSEIGGGIASIIKKILFMKN